MIKTDEGFELIKLTSSMKKEVNLQTVSFMWYS